MTPENCSTITFLLNKSNKVKGKENSRTTQTYIRQI